MVLFCARRMRPGPTPYRPRQAGERRQAVVPRGLLGRVTAAWRLGSQGVTLAGGVLAGAAAGLLGDDPRPVFMAAGTVTLVTVATAWFVALRHEDAGPLALRPRGR
jgi:hypothetical protein